MEPSACRADGESEHLELPLDLSDTHALTEPLVLAATHLPGHANFLDPRTQERHALPLTVPPKTDQGTVESTSCLNCLQDVRRATSAGAVQQGLWQCLFWVHWEDVS